MSEPLIKDCACGHDHETMPRDIVCVEEDGTEYWADMVCMKHKCHKPCRRCLRLRSGATTTEEYLDWLRGGSR